MFYSRQIYTFLVESISNHVLKKKRKSTQIATRQKQSPRGVLQIAVLSLRSETLNQISLRFKVFAFDVQNSKSTYYAVHVSVKCFRTKAQIEHTFTLILIYDFLSYRTNNTCKDFLIFRYFISYDLFLKTAFLSIHGHFAFIKVKTTL